MRRSSLCINDLNPSWDYEKQKTCYYLIKMMNVFNPRHYNAQEFYEKLGQYFAFKRLPKLVYSRNNEKIKEFRYKLSNFLEERYIALKCKASSLEKRINYIANLYNLDEYELEYFSYAVLKAINPVLQQFAEVLDRDDYSEFYNFGHQVLGLRTWQIESIGEGLQEKGLFSKPSRYSDKYSFLLNARILEVFENRKIKTNAQIKKMLLGSTMKADLKYEDFGYIEKEREIVLNILSSAIEKKVKGVNILLYGGVGTGKTQFAKMIANKAKVDMYAVFTGDLEGEASRKERLCDLASKQAILSKIGDSCILFDEAEDVMNRGFSEVGGASKGYLNNLLEETPVPVLWTTNNIRNVDPAFLRRMTYAIAFEKLNEDLRLNIWKKVLRKNKLKVDSKKLAELNKNYEIAPSLIANAVKTTKLIGGNQEDFEGFVQNVAQVVTKKKSVKKKKEFEMNDYNTSLVNPDLDICDLTNKIKNCGKLNFSLCLYGEPGTGKSLYARYLAKELGVDVILKRASDLMSKWVGETEQNIAEAFAEAKEQGAMLIFDEADSFLQNRNNAQRSWEVSQVNEMLTWMESHEYPFVCTTNLLDTLDEASLRRFTFKIRFDFLSKNQVNSAIEHFFNIKDADVNIKGLTAGDFATVKKKADFLNITDLSEITKMLQDEVKVKKTKTLQNTIGF